MERLGITESQNGLDVHVPPLWQGHLSQSQGAPNPNFWIPSLNSWLKCYFWCVTRFYSSCQRAAFSLKIISPHCLKTLFSQTKRIKQLKKNINVSHLPNTPQAQIPFICSCWDPIPASFTQIFCLGVGVSCKSAFTRLQLLQLWFYGAEVKTGAPDVRIGHSSGAGITIPQGENTSAGISAREKFQEPSVTWTRVNSIIGYLWLQETQVAFPGSVWK